MSIFAVYINILTVNDDASARLTVAHRYALGYQMGCNDDPYQENYIGTGVIHGHSHDFTDGITNHSFMDVLTMIPHCKKK